jgi:CheY-like chemotaxis protein
MSGRAIREREIAMNGKKNGNEKPARILVVDNDQLIAWTLGAILEEQGYEVATAFSGEEAVAKAPVFVPHLLVSDINMGAMSGVEAAIRITTNFSECKVLFLSGLASNSDILDTAPERLVYSFASKPLPPLDLLSAIAYMLPVLGPLNGAAVASEHVTITRESTERMLFETGAPLQLQEGIFQGLPQLG